MCGLTLSISPISPPGQAADTRVIRSLHVANGARGPNAHGVYARRVSTGAGDVLVTLAASVLGLRGETVTPQPLVGKRGALAWNGQVFSGLDVGVHENDTAKIFARLEAGDDPLAVLAAVEGPWAFVYISFVNGTVTFAVDPLSRRSLLMHVPSPDTQCRSFILSSTRSADARAEGIALNALDGGQVGVIDFGRLERPTTGDIDWTSALKLSQLGTKVSPVNRLLPSSPIAFEAVDAEVDNFIERLTASVRRRVENIPAPAPSGARVAILFSGGVDCSLLTSLIHRCLPPGEPIELVNVAFAQPPRTHVQKPNAKPKVAPAAPGYDVPDRVSGREALAELRAACPGREFRFVEVDVDIDESRAHRQAIIDTMYPSSTEMDLSLAYPLYFASMGNGVLATSEDAEAAREPYTVTAKVYFSGLGADEQLAGYSRHRKAYERQSWAGLVDEIQLDLDRLPQRNLSRDDRVLSAHARDARYPYLDLNFVSYVSALPVWAKCNLEFPSGDGDKSLIRQAALRCGLPATARRVKRAMQFGTKSAKLYEGAPRGYRAGEQAISEA